MKINNRRRKIKTETSGGGGGGGGGNSNTLTHAHDLFAWAYSCQLCGITPSSIYFAKIPHTNAFWTYGRNEQQLTPKERKNIENELHRTMLFIIYTHSTQFFLHSIQKLD